MATPSRKDVTDLLIEWGKGDQEALNKLMPLVYDELHRLASRFFVTSGPVILFRPRRWFTKRI